MPDDSPHALRLTFAWRDSQISLVASERVAMIVPASVPEPDVPATTGYSFALLDANGRVLYRRPLHSPIRIDAEAFSPGRGRAIERVPLASTDGRFTLLVPDSRMRTHSACPVPRIRDDPTTQRPSFCVSTSTHCARRAARRARCLRAHAAPADERG